jgi:hypothetical protein
MKVEQVVVDSAAGAAGGRGAGLGELGFELREECVEVVAVVHGSFG